MNELPESDEGGGGVLNHLPAILWQRRWLVVIPLVAGSIAGTAAAFLLPTIYRSSAVLVVQSQELPADLVGSPVTALIDQRIAKIRQQVLSRGDLINLIQQNNMYEAERQTEPLSKLVEKMRQSTQVSAVSADIGQREGASNTVAFSLSFDYEDPFKAQAVVQSFVDSFLELDSTQLSNQAATTVDFLSEQSAELQKQIADIEGQITTIKTQNGSALASAGMMTAANAGSYDAQIAGLQRENAMILQQARMVQKDPGVAAAEAQLASARAIYAESHPDVAFARQRLREAQRLAAANKTNSGEAIAALQIAGNNAQIAALGRERSLDAARSSTVAAAQARAPVVMEQVAQLETRANSLRTQYQTVSTRLLEARNSAKMESEDKGERLSLSDPPVVPDDPLSPNRPMLIVGGIAGGALAGFILAMLMELVLRPIRGVAEIERVMGVPPLVVIPTLTSGPSFRDRLAVALRLFKRRLARGKRKPQPAD